VFASVLNVSALRTATSLATDQPLYLKGYYTPGDGGEGIFLYNPSDTTSDDKGTIIPDSDGESLVSPDRGSTLQRQVVRCNGKWDHQ
jgi:hypothetical protein